jgi:hypothetical protein
MKWTGTLKKLPDTLFSQALENCTPVISVRIIDPYRGNSNLIDNLLAAECLIGNSIILERRTEFPES